jgi:hypothetical protein
MPRELSVEERASAAFGEWWVGHGRRPDDPEHSSKKAVFKAGYLAALDEATCSALEPRKVETL